MTSGGIYTNMPTQSNGLSMASASAYDRYTGPSLHVEAPHGAYENLTDDLKRLNVHTENHKDKGAANTTLPDARPAMFSDNATSFPTDQVLYRFDNGTVVYTGSPQYLYHQYNNHLTTPFQPPYGHVGYANLAQHGHANIPSTPHAQPWLASQALPPVPDLVNRRSSWSSNEEASPQTPGYANWHAPLIANKYSPSTWTTPSPLSSGSRPFLHYARYPNGKPYLADFWAWTHLEPAIPQPVPARHSGPDGGRGSLDKILDNPDGTTNVYVRGLQPNTTDELLGLYGQRFGEIDSQKAIVDHASGKCKGFGFIKYHNFIAAENCIRAFYHLGYEAKFARESHNSRLKALSDMANTNLYISNLPKTINEDGLKNIFASVFPPETFPAYRAGSCKILKDTCGISRGVGFARFENPEICDIIVETFNNKVVGAGDETTTLQVRYADTPKQKELKAQTAVKRQFKADEYNEAVYGIPFPHPSPVSPAYGTPLHMTAGSQSNGTWTDPSPISSISPSTYAGYPNSVLRAGRHTAAIPGQVARAPATHIKIESPSALAAAKKAVAAQGSDDTSTDVGSSNRSDRALPSSKQTSVSTYASAGDTSPHESK